MRNRKGIVCCENYVFAMKINNDATYIFEQDHLLEVLKGINPDMYQFILWIKEFDIHSMKFKRVSVKKLKMLYAWDTETSEYLKSHP